jgi:hypothetical protein
LRRGVRDVAGKYHGEQCEEFEGVFHMSSLKKLSQEGVSTMNGKLDFTVYQCSAKTHQTTGKR